jgi:hypothetical protein
MLPAININIDYNINNNLAYNPHLFERKEQRMLDLDKIEETALEGRAVRKRCGRSCMCLSRYFGKENVTYFVIVRKHRNFREVMTAWQTKGN